MYFFFRSVSVMRLKVTYLVYRSCDRFYSLNLQNCHKQVTFSSWQFVTHAAKSAIICKCSYSSSITGKNRRCSLLTSLFVMLLSPLADNVETAIHVSSLFKTDKLCDDQILKHWFSVLLTKICWQRWWFGASCARSQWCRSQCRRLTCAIQCVACKTRSTERSSRVVDICVHTTYHHRVINCQTWGHF